MPQKLIICLTGTGNSYYVARRLQEKLGYDGLLLAPDVLRDPSLLGAPKEIGVVFPTYKGLPPKNLAPLMGDVLSDGRLRMEFFFAISTCAASPGHSLEAAEQLALDADILTSYLDYVPMPSTYPVNRPIAPIEDLRRAFAKADAKISKIADGILSGGFKIPRRKFLAKSAIKSYIRLCRSPETPLVASSEACVRCGRCVQVCPRGAITLAESGPVFGDSCENCMACYHFCPSHAIVLRRHPETGMTYYPASELTGYDPCYR